MEQRLPDAVAEINSSDPASSASSDGDLPHQTLPFEQQSLHIASINASAPHPLDSSNHDLLHQTLLSDEHSLPNAPAVIKASALPQKDSSIGDHHQPILHCNDQTLPDATNFISTNSAPTDRSNSGLRHEGLPPLHAADTSHGNLEFELERSRSANQDLVEDVSYLRDAMSNKEFTTELLQTQLHENLARVQELSCEIASLEEQKRDHADTAACLAREVHSLHAEMIDLQEESMKMSRDKKLLADTFEAIRKKLYSLERDLDWKVAAKADAQAQVHMICFEVEKLRLEREEYSKEVSLLDADKNAMAAQIGRLQQEEKDLINDMENIAAAHEQAEKQVSKLQAKISRLKKQFLMSSENKSYLVNQSDDAKKWLGDLENTDKIMALREAEIAACVKDLQHRLNTVRVDLDPTCLVEDEEEKMSSSRTCKLPCMNQESNEGDLQTLRSAPSMRAENVDPGKQHIQCLESKVAALRGETQALMRSNKDLKAFLLQQQKEMAVVTKLKEEVKMLEGTVIEAENKAKALKETEAGLISKVEQLAISVRCSGLSMPLIIFGGTMVMTGVIVCLYLVKSKSK